MRTGLTAFVVALAAGAAWAAPARAEEAAGASDMRALVQKEVKAALDAKAAQDAKDLVMTARWKDGLVFETKDKAFSMKIGGRIHVDTQFVDAEDGLEFGPGSLGDDYDDTTFFRRLRFYLSGDLGKHVDFKFELDFADPSDGQARDAYVTLKNLKDCWGCWAPSIRVGQQYEPIGLETVTSDNHVSFVERAAMTALHPERSLGLQLFDAFWKDRATASIGIYSPDGDDDENGFALWDEEEADGGWVVTGRFSVVPWAKDTCHFVHLAASGSYRKPNSVQYRARPGLGRGPRAVDTGTLSDIDSAILLNAEAALVWNSLHVSGDYTLVDIDDPTRGDPSFSGWTVQAGWFLTGEARAYDFKRGLWGNTKPCCNFLSNGCCCWGAFELAARYDVLDLNDGAITGGELSTLTAGLNWYLTPNVRVMFDVVLSNVKDRVGPGGVNIDDKDVTAFLMRWDVHF